jgi:hypothetical protein
VEGTILAAPPPHASSPPPLLGALISSHAARAVATAHFMTGLLFLADSGLSLAFMERW